MSWVKEKANIKCERGIKYLSSRIMYVRLIISREWRCVITIYALGKQGRGNE